MPWWWKQYFPTKQLWRYGDLISNLKRQRLLIIFVTFCTCLTILDQFDEFQVFRVPKKKMMLKNWRKKIGARNKVEIVCSLKNKFTNQHFLYSSKIRNLCLHRNLDLLNFLNKKNTGRFFSHFYPRLVHDIH